MSSTSIPADAPVRLNRRVRVLLGFTGATGVGIALTVAGELSTPFDLANAIAVLQHGLVALVVAGALLAVGLAWPAGRRGVLVALAVLTPLTIVAFWLPAAWAAGCAGVALGWSVGALGRARPDHLRVERTAALVCGFAAAAWFLVYASALMTDLLRAL